MRKATILIRAVRVSLHVWAELPASVAGFLKARCTRGPVQSCMGVPRVPTADVHPPRYVQQLWGTASSLTEPFGHMPRGCRPSGDSFFTPSCTRAVAAVVLTYALLDAGGRKGVSCPATCTIRVLISHPGRTVRELSLHPFIGCLLFIVCLAMILLPIDQMRYRWMILYDIENSENDD